MSRCADCAKYREGWRETDTLTVGICVDVGGGPVDPGDWCGEWQPKPAPAEPEAPRGAAGEMEEPTQ